MNRLNKILEEMVAIASMMDVQPINVVGAVMPSKKSKDKYKKKTNKKGSK